MKIRLLTLFIFACLTATAQKYESVSQTYNFDLNVNLDDVDLEALSKAEGKYYALLIGVEEYRDKSIRKLDQPYHDALLLKKTLMTYYTFDQDNIFTLQNPTRSDLIIQMEAMAARITGKDNLIIFYAGHGYFDDKTELGYWLPADANQNDRSSWFPNSMLRDYIKGIKSKHTLLVADACFSGSIFKGRAGFKRLNNANEAYDQNSRKAMTSGNLKEVPDKSIFIEYICKRLEQNPRPYITGKELYESMRRYVENNSPNGQKPVYGEIVGTGDEGGDFVFFRKKK